MTAHKDVKNKIMPNRFRRKNGVANGQSHKGTEDKVMDLLSEIKSDYHQQMAILEKLLPDINRENHLDLLKEEASKFGQVLGNQELGITKICKDLDSYKDYLILKDPATSKAYQDKFREIKQIIEQDIEGLKGEEEPSVGTLAYYDSELKRVTEKIEQLKELNNEDQEHAFQKQITEIERQHVNRLNEIVNKQVGKEVLRKPDEISAFFQRQRDFLQEVLQEEIKLRLAQARQNAQSKIKDLELKNREEETAPEESPSEPPMTESTGDEENTAISSDKAAAPSSVNNTVRPEEEDNKAVSISFVEIQQELELLSQQEQTMLQLEATTVNDRKKFYKECWKDAEEDHKKLVATVKKIISNKKKRGIVINTRLQLVVTLMILLLILTGELAIVYSTLRVTLNLSLPGWIAQAQFLWNFTFIVSFTLAFSLAIKFFFSSWLKITYFKRRKRRRWFAFRANKANDRQEEELDLDDWQELKRQKRRKNFSLILVILAILGTIAIEPSNMFKLMETVLASGDGLPENITTLEPETPNFLNWLYHEFSYIGVLIFLICITVLYGGVGGMLYYDFFRMYEKFRNSGRSIWFRKPKAIRSLLEEKQQLEEGKAKTEQKLEKLKTSLLDIEKQLMSYSHENVDNIKRFIEDRKAAEARQFAMAYDLGSRSIITKADDDDELLVELQKIDIATEHAKKNLTPWSTIFDNNGIGSTNGYHKEPETEAESIASDSENLVDPASTSTASAAADGIEDHGTSTASQNSQQMEETKKVIARIKNQVNKDELYKAFIGLFLSTKNIDNQDIRVRLQELFDRYQKWEHLKKDDLLEETIAQNTRKRLQEELTKLAEVLEKEENISPLEIVIEVEANILEDQTKKEEFKARVAHLLGIEIKDITLKKKDSQ